MTTPTLPRTRVDAARMAALQAAFRTLDTVAPSFSARWALRLWCTLPANGGRRRDERPFHGERSSVDLPGGRSVVVETWGTGEPVHLVHGWGGWRGQLGAFVQPLLDAGRRVVAFDAPSHGESPPGELGAGRSTAIEFIDALTAVAGRHGAPAGVIAHSLGCTTAALALREGVPAERFAMIAPSADVIGMLDEMARLLRYTERTDRLLIRRLEELADRALSDFDLTRIPASLPTLVVHDRKDKEAPYAAGAAVADAWPQARLLTTDGLGHQRILRDPCVVDEVSRFVAG